MRSGIGARGFDGQGRMDTECMVTRLRGSARAMGHAYMELWVSMWHGCIS